MENLSSIEGDLCKIIDYLKTLNLKVEVCGLWLWISGDIRYHKQKLKELGFRWSFNKRRWFYKPRGVSNRLSNGSWSMEQIRAEYGSTMIDNH